jgi:hypothetical protein
MFVCAPHDIMTQVTAYGCDISVAATARAQPTQLLLIPPSVAVVLLQEYSGAALNNRLAAVNIDRAAVESALAAMDPAPAPAPAELSKNLDWVAAPVVGGCAFVAACAAVFWWLNKHRHAQATGTKEKYMDTMAEAAAKGQDGATPREGSARAQATLN